MKKQFLFIILALALAFTVIMSGCSSKITLSGKYISAEDNSVYLEFGDKAVLLYEGSSQTRSGTYRFQDNALIISYEGFAERYTLNENKDTLFYGNSAKDNAGEIAFVKES